LEIGSPALDLMKPIFYGWRVVRILVVYIGEFRSDFVQFETFKVQKVNDMTVLQFHQSGPFELFTIYTSEMPAIFSGGNPKLS
jgi:hypothetical protein